MSKPKAAFAGESLVQNIPLSLIFADANQVRRTFDEEALQQLAASIREHGVIQPIVVRPIDATGVAPFEIIAGERRWRASQIAERETIPAVIRIDLIGQDVSVLQILENLQRQDLPLQETAAGVAKLVEKVGNKSAAQQLGKSEGWVSKHARLAALPESVVALVQVGKIESADIAHDIAQVIEISGSDSWRARELLESAEAGLLTRAEAREELESAKAAAQREAERARNSSGQQDLLDDDDDDEQSGADTQEFLERKRRLDEEDAARQRAMDRQEKARAKRKAHIEQLAAEVNPIALQWITALHERLGLKAGRDEDTGDFLLEDYGDDLVIEPQLPTIYNDAPMPKSAGAIQFALRLILNREQMDAVVALLTGAGDSDAPEKQGDLDVAAFIAERVNRTDPEAKVKADAFHAAYVAWCKKRKATPLSFNDNRWADAIDAAGIEKYRHKTGRYFLGVSIK